jgi:hypothetical protein
MMIDPEKVADFFHGYSIRRERALYAKSSRPIHAWRAYYWIRKAGLPVPPWFLEYLDGCAERLMKSPLKKPEEVAEAFGMTATGRHLTEGRRLAAVQMVCALKQDKKQGERDEDIWRKVANDLGVNWTYVRNAYQDWLTKN